MVVKNVAGAAEENQQKHCRRDTTAAVWQLMVLDGAKVGNYSYVSLFRLAPFADDHPIPHPHLKHAFFFRTKIRFRNESMSVGFRHV